MKNKVSSVLIASLLAFAPVLVQSDEGHEHATGPQGKSMTVKGEVLDMACYMSHEGKGAKHKDCAQSCVKGGSPMGLLTKDGEVILLVEDHADNKAYLAVKDLAGDNAEIKGQVFHRGGLEALVVKEAKKIS